MQTLRQALLKARRAYVREVFALSDGSAAKAAITAGISRASFYRLMADAKVSTQHRSNRGNAAWRSLSDSPAV
jgi:DNA-binding NtrC family response regulator